MRSEVCPHLKLYKIQIQSSFSQLHIVVFHIKLQQPSGKFLSVFYNTGDCLFLSYHCGLNLILAYWYPATRFYSIKKNTFYYDYYFSYVMFSSFILLVNNYLETEWFLVTENTFYIGELKLYVYFHICYIFKSCMCHLLKNCYVLYIQNEIFYKVVFLEYVAEYLSLIHI